MKKILALVIAVTLSNTIAVSVVNAHGLATTKSELVDKYLVQLEYDTLGNISAGGTTSFSFEILDPDTKQSIDFDRVFVRIAAKEGYYPLSFSGNLFPMEGFGVKSARATIWVAREGQYDIEVDYYKADKQLATHTFELTVDPPYTRGDDKKSSVEYQKYLWMVTLVAGIIIGLALRRSSRKNDTEKK